jgi:hypothetical protein
MCFDFGGNYDNHVDKTIVCVCLGFFKNDLLFYLVFGWLGVTKSHACAEKQAVQSCADPTHCQSPTAEDCLGKHRTKREPKLTQNRKSTWQWTGIVLDCCNPSHTNTLLCHGGPPQKRTCLSFGANKNRTCAYTKHKNKYSRGHL